MAHLGTFQTCGRNQHAAAERSPRSPACADNLANTSWRSNAPSFSSPMDPATFPSLNHVCRCTTIIMKRSYRGLLGELCGPACTGVWEMLMFTEVRLAVFVGFAFIPLSGLATARLKNGEKNTPAAWNSYSATQEGLLSSGFLQVLQEF